MPDNTRIAFVTVGQAPRGDIVDELIALMSNSPDELVCEQFGALGGLTPTEIALGLPNPKEGRLYTRIANGSHVIVSAGFVARRLEPLLGRLDSVGYDLIVLISTGIFQALRVQTPFVHGQQTVDAWIAGLLMGNCELGLIYPLAQQHRPFAHGKLIQNIHAVAASVEITCLHQAADRLAAAELILMHSVGYTEEMAHQMAELTRKPVVTARRIIAASMRLALSERASRPKFDLSTVPLRSEAQALVNRLPGSLDHLTPREQQVLAAMLQGDGNKAIGRRLGISHRTVEIHRARLLAKLNAASSIELIRRAAMMRET